MKTVIYMFAVAMLFSMNVWVVYGIALEPRATESFGCEVRQI